MNKKWDKKYKINKLYAIISANILTLLLIIIFAVVIASILSGCSKSQLVYKTKEVNIAVRCDIELPPLPNIIEGMQADDIAVEVAKSFELHRQAILCCTKGLCE